MQKMYIVINLHVSILKMCVCLNQYTYLSSFHS